MNETKDNLLEEIDLISILVGFIIGTDILALPSLMARAAKQDGWISVIVGGWYPLFISILSIYFAKNHPNEDILVLSKRYLGNILGNICNILFMAQFAMYSISVTTSLSNIFRVYATQFLTPIKIFLPTLFLVVYLSLKGIKVIARINKMTFYITLILILTLIASLQRGSYLNVSPIFGTGYENILNGSISSTLAYSGMEAIFLFYPFLKDKNKVKAATLKATAIIIGIYTWVTFVTIYYLGYKATSKSLWPVLLITESVDFPIISSFRVLFLFLWSISMFKIITNDHFAATYTLSKIFKIKNIKNMYFYIIPITLYFCLQIKSEMERRAFLDKVVLKVTIFNIVYPSVIAIMIFIKNLKKEKSK